MPAHIDLTGKKLGRLTALKKARKKGLWYWECHCECGKTKLILAGALTRKSKPTRSCGCIVGGQAGPRNSRYKHGHAAGGKRSRTLNVWSGMIDRCRRSTNKNYANYGGRGIRVDERWLNFENFLNDMGAAPDGMSLDRIDNSGNYGPDNCRWTTQKEQTRNCRANRLVEFKGEVKPLSQWCEEMNLNYSTVHSRIHYLGWPIEDALTIRRCARKKACGR